jgi:hypothetical protein
VFSLPGLSVNLELVILNAGEAGVRDRTSVESVGAVDGNNDGAGIAVNLV